MYQWYMASWASNDQVLAVRLYSLANRNKGLLQQFSSNIILVFGPNRVEPPNGPRKWTPAWMIFGALANWISHVPKDFCLSNWLLLGFIPKFLALAITSIWYYRLGVDAVLTPWIFRSIPYWGCPVLVLHLSRILLYRNEFVHWNSSNISTLDILMHQIVCSLIVL